MDNRRLGAEGLALEFSKRSHMVARPMEIARAINHAVVATEWVARLILVLAALLVLYFAADREPPFALLSSTRPAVHAGDYATIHNKVKRDTSRGCNTQFSRFLFDANGARYDLGSASASAETIAMMERRTPGELVIVFRVPPTVAAGQATLQTVIQYRCNRVHALWPIETTVEMPFQVLP